MNNPPVARETLEECLNCACLSYRQASRMVTQLFDDMLVPVGLLSTQLPVLIYLAYYGPLTISRLATMLVMDRTTLTRILKPLQKRKYVQNVATDDRRKTLLEIAPKGYEIMIKAYPHWKKAQSQITDGLKPQTWEKVRKQLAQVVEIASKR